MGESGELSGVVHVVVLPYPSQGHINPLLQFAKRLASKGVKTTLATTAYTAPSINSPNVTVEPISDGFDHSAGAVKTGEEDSFLKSFKENGSKTLSQLIHKYQNSTTPVSCIVYDAFFPWALDVAMDQGIYGAAFFTNSATVCAIFCSVHHGSLSLPLEEPEEIESALPKLPRFKHSELPSLLRRPESYPAYLAMKLSQFSNLEMAHWIFCNSFQILESEAIEGIANKWPAKMIGPMIPSYYLDNRIKEDKGYGASLWKPLSDKCRDWLTTKPPNSVIYISFGSMVSLTHKQTEEIASALEETTFHFLWVIRESQFSKLPQQFPDSIKEKGMIVTWCNQLEVLANPAIGCFVTHCGWNSTLEGLSLGVPMIGMPQWSDQMTDAKFIEEVWRVGVRAKEGEDGVVGKREFLLCLEEVMGGERSMEIRKNAIKWKDLAKEAISEGGSSDKEIDGFLKQLKKTE